MAEHAGKPKVRFAGFTEDWEQRKLVSLCEKFTDGDWIEAKDQSNSGVRLIQTGNVGLGEYIDKQNNKKWISKETFERLNCEEVFSGDILISRLPEPAGRACIVPNLGTKMITAVDCTIVRTATQVNPKYLLQYLSSQSYFDEVNTCLAGGTRQRISRSNLATFDVSMPVKYEEQKAIGEFLCGMDHLITLHQRKRGRLENIKKAMLEKMFPKNGADVPEVRFAGFTEAWEQRKVGEYYDFKNGLNKGKEYFGIGTPIVNFTDVFHLRGIYEKDLKGKVSLTRAEIANFQVKMGDIFFTRTSETIDEIGFPSVMLDEPKDTVFSGFVLRGRALQDDPLTLQFKRYVFFTDAFRKEMVKKSSITTRALTSGTAIKNMEFVFPKNKKEQEFIGNFFRHLDRLITLHQRKVALLQNIKKACLEKMFV